jgi:hypothetical protein
MYHGRCSLLLLLTRRVNWSTVGNVTGNAIHMSGGPEQWKMRSMPYDSHAPTQIGKPLDDAPRAHFLRQQLRETSRALLCAFAAHACIRAAPASLE